MYCQSDELITFTAANLTMTKQLTAALLFVFAFCFAQPGHRMQIDTADAAFKQKLKIFYSARAARTASSFKNIRDRRLAKAVSESYNELNSGFIAKANEGFFCACSFLRPKN